MHPLCKVQRRQIDWQGTLALRPSCHTDRSVVAHWAQCRSQRPNRCMMVAEAALVTAMGPAGGRTEEGAVLVAVSPSS